MADERYNLGKTVKNYEYEKFKNEKYADVHGYEVSEYIAHSDDSTVDSFDDANIDKFEQIYNVPYAQTHTTDGIVTPMEYYQNIHDTSDSKFRLSSTEANATTVPVYFWVETLKNWCTYVFSVTSLNNKKQPCFGIADLHVWNGQNCFIRLSDIMQQQYSCQLTLTQMKKYVDEYKKSKDQKAKELLDRYKNIVLANMCMYRFPYERLHTTDVVRIYHPKHDPDYDVNDSSFFVFRTIKSVANFIRHCAMFIIDYSIPALIYNSINSGVGSAFSAGYNRWTSAMSDLVGSVRHLIAPLSNWLFTDAECARTASSELAKVNPKDNVVAGAIYLSLPYDSGYVSNDQDTFQTIRYRNTWGTDGRTNGGRHLETVFQVPNPICSPLIVRSTIGELTLAITMAYTGPIKQWEDAEDYTKQIGLSQEDVDSTNKILAKMFGDGSDKTADDFLNVRGGILTDDLISNSDTSMKSTLFTGKVEQTTSVSTANGEITITPTRSKVSSEVTVPTINTVTKW